MIGHGWLAALPPQSPPWDIEGVPLDRPGTRTRFEEFTLLAKVARSLPSGRAWDAATGYIPGWHIAPEILAALGWEVHACDLNARTLEMPSPPGVTRYQHNMIGCPLASDSCGLTVSISVIEHLATEEARDAFVAEAARITRPGGVLVLTADGFSPERLAELVRPAFEPGALVPGGPGTEPEVGWVVARRL